MHGQTQVRKPHGAAQPCRSSNPVRGWQKQAELLHPFLQNWITHPSFNLRDCHIYSSLFTSSPFQSQSMSPMYQSFLLSLIQFLCSQIRPQPTKIWVSKIFLAPLQPPSFQQEPAAQAGSEQPASSSPHLVVLSIGEKKKKSLIFRIWEQTRFLGITWGTLPADTPGRLISSDTAVFIHFFIWVFQLPPFPPREKKRITQSFYCSE